MSADYVTSLEISLGTALLQRPLERYTTKAGKQVCLSGPSAGTQSYLWVARAPDAAAVTDIKVLYDDEAVPEGYKRTRDASGGAAAKVYLAYRCSASVTDTDKPIANIALLADGEAPDAGFVLVERSITREGPAIRIAVQRADDASEEGPSAWAEGLKQGDLVDVLASGRRWRAGNIAAVSADGKTLTVSLKGWAEKYNEEMPRASKRLAKPGTHTAGQDTRAVRRQGELFEVDLAVLEQLEMRVDDYISGDFPPEERDLFAKGELPAYLETALSSSYASEELQERINRFNQKVQELIVFHLKKVHEPLPPEVRQHLNRMALNDSNCNFFFERYGATLPTDEKAATTNGFAARLPLPSGASRFYVMNVNKFYELGGYDAILTRLTLQNEAARAAMARGEAATAATPAAGAASAADGGDSTPAAGDATPAAAASAPKADEGDMVDELLVSSAVCFVPRACYTLDFAKKYYQPLRDAIFERVLTLSEAQLKKASKDAIETVRKQMEDWAMWMVTPRGDNPRYSAHQVEILSGPTGACAGDTHYMQAVERWQLAVSLRLLRCDALTLRVKAVTDIKTIVEAVDAGVSSRQAADRRAANSALWSYYSQPAAAPVARWFDTPRLVAWLLDNRVVDIVLGEKVPLATSLAAGDAASATAGTAAANTPICPVKVQTVSKLATIIEFLARAEYSLVMKLRQPAALAKAFGKARVQDGVLIDAEGVVSLEEPEPVAAAAPAAAADAAAADAPAAAADAEAGAAGAAGGAAAAAAAAPAAAPAIDPATQRFVALANLLRGRQAVSGHQVSLLVKILREEGEDDMQKCVLEILATLSRNRTVPQLTHLFGELAGLVDSILAGAAQPASGGKTNSLLRAPLIEAIRDISHQGFTQVNAELEHDEAAARKAGAKKALAEASKARAAAEAAGQDGVLAFEEVTRTAGDAAAEAVLAAAAAESSNMAWTNVPIWWGIALLWTIVQRDGAAPAAAAAAGAAAADAAPAEAAATTTTSSSSGVPIQQLAADALVTLLKEPTRYRQLDHVLSAVWENIRAASAPGATGNVLTNLRLADALLRALPLASRDVPHTHCAEMTITRLNAAFDLTTTLIGEMKGYKAKAAEAARARGIAPFGRSGAAPPTGAAAADDEALIFLPAGGAGAKSSHVDQVAVRLGLYSHIVQQGDMEVTTAAITELWATFVDAALTAAEAETFFHWLKTARFPGAAATASTKAMAERALPTPLCAALFKTLFCSPAHFSVASVGPKGFAAFDAFFRLTNAAAGRLTTSGTGDDAADIIAHDAAGLEGLETLWSLALGAGAHEVSRAALQLLIDIHAKVQPLPAAGSASAGSGDARLAIVAAKQAVWSGFVAHCMATLTTGTAAITAAAAAGTPAGPSVRTVAKVLRLLTTFLETVEATGKKTDDRAQAVRASNHSVKVLVEGPPLPPTLAATKEVSAFLRDDAVSKTSPVNYQVTVRPAVETLGCVRSRLAEVCDVDVTRILLTELGGDGKVAIGSDKDHLLMASAGFAYGLSGFVLPAPNAATSGNVYLSKAKRAEVQLRNYYTAEGMPEAEIDAIIASTSGAAEAEAGVTAAPRRSLSDSAAYFEQLFALLSLHNAVIVSDAWGLLQTLPVNAKVQADIHTLQGAAGDAAAAASGSAPDWDAILDGSAPLKLLYSLQIMSQHIDKLVADAAGSAMDAAGAAAGGAGGDAAAAAPPAPVDVLSTAWGKAFVAEGGVAHLAKLIATVDFAELVGGSAGQLPKECARLLLATFSRFVVAEGDALRTFYAGATAPVFAPDRASLVRRLVSVLSVIATAGAPAAGGDADGDASGSSATDKGGVGTWTKTGGDDDGDMGLGSLYSGGADLESFWEDDSSYASKAKGGASKGKQAAAAASAGTAKAGNKGADAAIVALLLRLLHGALLGKNVAVSLDAAARAPTIASVASPDAADALVDALYGTPALAETLAAALLVPRDATVRAAVSVALRELAAEWGSAGCFIATTERPEFAVVVAGGLLGAVETAYAFPDACVEFFETLASMLKALPKETAPPAPGSPALVAGIEAATHLAGLIKAHPIVEVGVDAKDITDHVLQGLFAVVRALLAVRPFLKEYVGMPTVTGSGTGLDLVEEVYERCLFAVPSDEGAPGGSPAPATVLGGRLPKCKQKSSRSAAFDLLVELAVDCEPIAVKLCASLLPHHDPDAAAALAAASPHANPLLSKPAGATNALKRGKSDLDLDDDEGSKAPKGRGKYGSISSTDPVSQGGSGQGGAASGGAGASEDAAAVSLANRSRTLTDPRNSTGYVGLYNLGCICYMNSTMQQFFMNPAFRKGVLSWAEPAHSSAEEKKDSLMYQMQRQFAYLQESEKQYFTPRGLCYAIKDWEGNPTNIAEQKDVPEYMTKLFADMETQCQGTPIGTLAKDVFGGTSLQEMIAEDPTPGKGGSKKLYSTRNDDFYFLQVRVKGNRTLQDALHEYVAGETVEYSWELPADEAPAAADAGAAVAVVPAKPRKVSAKTIKRTSLNTLGDHLMVHLSRFQYNYDSDQQEKLNDRFEFPRTLDMWPYTVNGRPDAFSAADKGTDAAAAAASASTAVATLEDRSEYVFELVGVVIHMGTAIGGHYFSYIRERDEHGAGERWYEFNDAHVSPWSATDAAFDRDCFGGVETRTTPGSSYTSYTNGVARLVTNPPSSFEYAKSSNAFVLYYDKVKKTKPTATSAAAPAVAAAAATPAAAVADVAAPATTTGAAAVATTGSSSSSSSALPANPRALYASRVVAAASAGVGVGGKAGSALRRRYRAPMPTDLADVIAAENLDFLRLRNIFELEYFAFNQQVVRAMANITAPALAGGNPFSAAGAAAAAGSKYDVGYPAAGLPSLKAAVAAGGPAMAGVRLATNFILNTLVDSNQKETFSVWSGLVKQMMSNNGVAAAWFLSTLLTDKAALKRMLWADSSFASEGQRSFLTALIAHAVHKVWSYEKDIPAAPLDADAAAAPAVASSPGDRAYPSCVPGQLIRQLVAFLVDQLSTMHIYWKRFDAYFRTLNILASVDAQLRATLSSAGLLGRLIDFALSGDSPHPEVNGSAPSHLRTMGDSYTVVNLEAVFSLIKTLAAVHLPPSGAPGSPIAQPPQVPLPTVDADLLTCKQLLAAFIAQSTTRRAAKANAGLLTHIFWGVAPKDKKAAAASEEEEAGAADAAAGAAAATDAAAAGATTGDKAAAAKTPKPTFGAEHLMSVVCGIVRNTAKTGEYAEQRPMSFFVGNLMDIAGDTPAEVVAAGGDPAAYQKARIDALSRAILGGLKASRRFFRSTELGIELFVKLAKNRPLLREWMSANADVWAWADAWYEANPRPSQAAAASLGTRDDGTSQRIVRRPIYAQYGMNMSQYYAPARDGATAWNIKFLLAGEQPEFDYAESDEEPTGLTGRRVNIVAMGNRRISGLVTGYDAGKKEYVVACDDGVTRTFDLAAMKPSEHTLEYSAAYTRRIKAIKDAEAAEAAAASAAADAADAAAVGAPADGAAAPAAGGDAAAAAPAPAAAAAADDDDDDDDPVVTGARRGAAGGSRPSQKAAARGDDGDDGDDDDDDDSGRGLGGGHDDEDDEDEVRLGGGASSGGGRGGARIINLSSLDPMMLQMLMQMGGLSLRGMGGRVQVEEIDGDDDDAGGYRDLDGDDEPAHPGFKRGDSNDSA